MPLSDKEKERCRPIRGKNLVAVWQGDLLEIQYVTPQKEWRRPGKRKPCVEFTRSARLRMLKTIARVNWNRVGPSLFITLTYPDECVRATKEERTVDRHRFMRDMENYLSTKVGMLWRQEWEPRKSGKRKSQIVNHIHLIAFDVRFIHYRVVNALWRAVLSAGGKLRTEVKRIKGTHDVARYTAKYCGKLSASSSLVDASYLNSLGRHWGIHRKELIPWHNRFVLFGCDEADKRLLENVAAHTFRFFTPNVDQGFSLLGGMAKKVGGILIDRAIDDGRGFD